ncbi:hypothetical protein PMG71_12350 [Roseofilum sp. BLCC_M154]|uniref:Uncharacterized protein n=1 Tax=Roseofilum acuticapitatum BLCC-M154 TaxID=3022444 RepID=A0ABT7ATI5_9CYAN|nr:hypothetical protein [Roseofilum acuticapitatum]MDJ1170222.1 hypothetical protein [Roseofilum acuticapitatum BLCC-M154]
MVYGDDMSGRSPTDQSAISISVNLLEPLLDGYFSLIFCVKTPRESRVVAGLLGDLW